MNSRLSDIKEHISDLEDRITKIIQTEQQREKQNFKNQNSLRDLQDNIKHTNIHFVGLWEGEERQNGIEVIFEKIMAENFPSVKKETDIQAQEVQRVPTRWTQTDPHQDIP